VILGNAGLHAHQRVPQAIAQLAPMFPSLHEEVIADVLGKVGGDVQLAVDALLAAQVKSRPSVTRETSAEASCALSATQPLPEASYRPPLPSTHTQTRTYSRIALISRY
jgi:hypothetical protein